MHLLRPTKRIHQSSRGIVPKLEGITEDVVHWYLEQADGHQAKQPLQTHH